MMACFGVKVRVAFREWSRSGSIVARAVSSISRFPSTLQRKTRLACRKIVLMSGELSRPRRYRQQIVQNRDKNVLLGNPHPSREQGVSLLRKPGSLSDKYPKSEPDRDIDEENEKWSVSTEPLRLQLGGIVLASFIGAAGDCDGCTRRHVDLRVGCLAANRGCCASADTRQRTGRARTRRSQCVSPLRRPAKPAVLQRQER